MVVDSLASYTGLKGLDGGAELFLDTGIGYDESSEEVAPVKGEVVDVESLRF